MNCFHIRVEFVATKFEILIDDVPSRGINLVAVLPRVLQLIQEATPLRLVRMQLNATVPESMLLKTAMDNIEGGCLLGNEENCLSHRQALRDDVRNCLAFSSSRRSDDDEIMSFRRSHDRSQL